ncbi:MAG: protein-glutamate O-methyltransferase CheR [Clostridia bacterium]
MQNIISITDQEFDTMVKFVYGKYGIDLKKKRQLVESRLAYILKSKSIDRFEDYLKLINTDENELQLFLNRITTNHSYFAREMEHFDYLLNTVLPELEKTGAREYRIWSAGCSGGQEAYNIAMAIDHYFGSRKGTIDTKILATDISSAVLSKAKDGIYTHDVIDGLPQDWIAKYFIKQPDGRFRVIDKIRQEVIFRKGNLMEPFQIKKPFDIIFCRNVMIYFDNETTQGLVEKFYNATAPNGHLFVGHSESVDKNRTRYEFVMPAIYKKIMTKGR